MTKSQRVPPTVVSNQVTPISAHHRMVSGNHSQRDFVTHPFAAIALILNGSSRIEHQSIWSLEPGCVVLTPAGHPHRVLESTDTEYLGAGFSTSVLKSTAVTKILTNVRFGAAPVVKIPDKRLQYFRTLFRELVDSEQSIDRELMFTVQTSLLSLMLSEVTKAAINYHPKTPGSIISNSLEYIEQHCLGPIKLQDVSKAVGRSPEYITSLLSQVTGQSFSKWVTTYRMFEARRLLLYSPESIEAISEKVGYGDTTHFVRMFKREHRTTPAAWRKNIKTYKPNKSK